MSSPFPAITVKRLTVSLLPNAVDVDEFLMWPPNLFALTSQILSLTGAYCVTVSPPDQETWPPDPARQDCKLFNIDSDWPKKGGIHLQWKDYVQQIGDDWRKKLKDFEAQKFFESDNSLAAETRKTILNNNISQYVPQSLRNLWNKFSELNINESHNSIFDLLCDDPAKGNKFWLELQILISLHAIADEACVGWGLKKIDGEENSKSQTYAEDLLKRFGSLATIDESRCRVLPKRHTPNIGITLRSLSSNLGFHRSSIEVNWLVTKDFCPLAKKLKNHGSDTFSILLLPWPLEIRGADFKQDETIKVSGSDRYGFFSYCPDSFLSTQGEGVLSKTDTSINFGKQELELIQKLRRILAKAKQEVKNIDIVVLPESSLSADALSFFEQRLTEFGVSYYVAGVREHLRNAVYFKARDVKSDDDNSIQFPNHYETASNGNHRYKQFKHHRWKLNRAQIAQYGLGHVLSPNKSWWEAIKIERRKVTFINIGDKLTLCPLICEDLARQDPIADLIRTVGPSLVITILMDGPQKTDRWSARYASVLADDPGSAVVTLTNYGMVKRWNPPNKPDSNAVALWNDGQSPPRELELEDGAVGILLSLSIKEEKEEMADGRVEKHGTGTITLGGIHQIHL